MTLVRFLRQVAYVLFPVLSALLALPIVTSAIPAALRQGEIHPVLTTIGLAFLAGLIAAPGYVFIAFKERDLATLGTAGRVWIRASLILAMVAALVGFGCTVFAFWPLAVLPLVTAILCIELSYRARRVWIQHERR